MAAPDVARAHTAAREIFGLRTLWAQIAALDDVVGTDTQISLLLEVRRLAERATRWLLRNRTQPLDIAATTEFFQPGVRELALLIPTLVTENRRRIVRAHRRRLRRRRRPEGPGVVGRDVARPHRGPGHHDGRPLHPAPRRRGGRGLLRARRVPEARLAAGPDTRPAARRPLAEPSPEPPSARTCTSSTRPSRPRSCGPARPARAARAGAPLGRDDRRGDEPLSAPARRHHQQRPVRPRHALGRAPRDPDPGAGQHPGNHAVKPLTGLPQITGT